MARQLLATGILFAASSLISSAAAFAQSSPSPYTSATRYDIAGRVTGTISPDPDGVGSGNPFLAVRSTYDPAGRLEKVEEGTLSAWQSEAVAPAGWSGFTVYRSVETIYDVMDRKQVETVKGSDGVAVSLAQFSYDGAGRVQCVAVRMNPAAYGSLPASACALGTQGSQGPDRITKNVYDLANAYDPIYPRATGQLLQVRKGVGTAVEIAEVTYSYTPNGKREYVIDANGNRARLTYDGLDRQNRWEFPTTIRPASFDDSTPSTAYATAGPVNGDDYEAYGYDANGNRIGFRKRDGSTLSYSYDALNRVTSKVVPERSGLSSAHTRDVHYGYDLRGLQTFARFDSSSGEGVTTAYDGFGRKTAETLSMDGASRTLVSVYDANGNRTALTWSDGNVINYYRDGLGRLYVAYLNGSSPLFYPGRNPDGTVAFLYRGVITGGYSLNAASVFGYDAAGRLSALTTGVNGYQYDRTASFTRNPASQIASVTSDNDAYAWTGHINVDRNYTANGLNQYATAGSASFTYDANGNLTGDGTNSYLYDVENRLVSRSGGGTASLRYDPLGRLYEVSGGALGVQRFQYDGDALVAEYDSAGTMLRRIVHGAEAGVDDPLVTFENSGMADSVRRYLYADERGSIVALTDQNGDVYVVNRYDEYGIPGPANAGRFQYTGQVWMPELGMYYYKARMYSPTLGRFMQTDPIGYDDGPNIYAYVGNDPVNGVDPTGTICTGSLITSGSGECRGGGNIAGGHSGSCEGSCRTSTTRANAAGDNAKDRGTPGQGDNGGPPLDEDDVRKGVLNWLARLAGRIGGGLASVAWSEPAGEGSDQVGPRFPSTGSQLGHIFQKGAGHYQVDTPTARSEIEGAVGRQSYIGQDGYGKHWFGRINGDGSQTWVTVRNGVITNAGRNATPENIALRMRYPK